MPKEKHGESRRGERVCDCAYRRGEQVGSCLMGGLERLLWPVSARPSDHWLNMFGTDNSDVGVTIVSGLWERYKL